MTSEVDSELKKKLINEVSRVQSSNLKRVESSSGMKTIFSSDDYNNKTSQPKPKFQRGHRGHQTPQSPGRNRIRVRHNEHKGISADLFENHSPVSSKETESKTIQADFVSSRSSFADDSLATSTLKPETTVHNQCSISDDRLAVLNGDVSSHLTNLSNQETVVQRREETRTTDINKNTISTVVSNNNESISPGSSLSRSSTSGYSGQSNLPTCVRAETEMTLPDSTIRQAEGMSAAEFNINDEDHAIQALLDLAEGQEAEMNRLENRDTYNTELSNSVSNGLDGSSADTSTDRHGVLRVEPGRSVNKRTSEEHKNMDEYNTYFDLKELVSSTPQTGSMHEDTASEIDSLNSGTGQRLDQLDNLNSKDISIEATTELHFKPDSPVHSHTNIDSSNIKSANTELHSLYNSEEIYKHESGVYSQNGDLSKPSMNRTEECLVQTDSQVKIESDELSQEDIDDTHRRFDQMLANMSSSFEEDFTMEERSVSDHLSSDAEVVVHKNQDCYTSTNHNGESDLVQEFTHLESSLITTQADVVSNNSAITSTKTDVAYQANNGQDFTLLELSRLQARNSVNGDRRVESSDIHRVETLTQTKIEDESSQQRAGLVDPVTEEMEEVGSDSGILLKTSQEQNTSVEVLDHANTSLHVNFDPTGSGVNTDQATSDGLVDLIAEEETIKQISPVVNAVYETAETNLDNEPTPVPSDLIDSPRDISISDIAQNHVVYSEAYDNEQIVHWNPVAEEMDEVGSDSGILLKTSQEQNTSVDVLDHTNTSLNMNFDPTGSGVNKDQVTSDGLVDFIAEEETIKQISPVVNAVYERAETNLNNEATPLPSDLIDSPRDSSISDDSQNHTVYSEAYDNEQIVRSYKTSLAESESSRVYETIGEDEMQRGKDTNVEISYTSKSQAPSEQLTIKSESAATGRLSPIGAEISSSETIAWDQKREYKTEPTVITTAHYTRSEPGVNSKPPVIAGSFLSRLKTGPMKSRSDFQTLSETVNVKGLAKHLEKSLDFSKMIRNPKVTEYIEETKSDKKKHPLNVKTMDQQNPKAAFGLVLNEIFKKNKQVNIEDEKTDEKPYKAYNLRPTSPTPLTTATDERIEETVNTDKRFDKSVNSDQRLDETVNTFDRIVKTVITDDKIVDTIIIDNKIVDTVIAGDRFIETVNTDERMEETANNDKRVLETVYRDKTIVEKDNADNNTTIAIPSIHLDVNDKVKSSGATEVSYNDMTVTSKESTTSDEEDEVITESYEYKVFDTTKLNNEMSTEATDQMISSQYEPYFSHNAIIGSTSMPNRTYKGDVLGDSYGQAITGTDRDNHDILTSNKQTFARTSNGNMPGNYGDRNSATVSSFRDAISSSSMKNIQDDNAYGSKRFSHAGIKSMSTIKSDLSHPLSTSCESQDLSESEQDESFVSITTLPDNESNLSDPENLSEILQPETEKTLRLSVTNNDNNRQEEKGTDLTYRHDRVSADDYNLKRDSVNIFEYDKHRDRVFNTDYNNRHDTVTTMNYDTKHDSVNLTDKYVGINSTYYNNTSGRVDVTEKYDNKRDLPASGIDYNNQNQNTFDYYNERVNKPDDNYCDRSLNSSMSDETYTSAHEEFLVPIPRSSHEIPERVMSERTFVERVVSDIDVTERGQQNKNFPSYRERFFDRSSNEGNIATNESVQSTKTFLHEPDKLDVTDSREGQSDGYVNSELQNRSDSELHSINWAFQQQTLQNESNLADGDTVQGSSASPTLNSVHLDYSLFTSALGDNEKPAKQLHGYNINIVKKEDRSDHVTGSSSSQPVYVKDDVTTEWDKTEEFVTSREKLSESAFPSNFTSQPEPRKHERSVKDNRHSLFYDNSVEDVSLTSDQRYLTTPSRRYITGENKNKKGNMAYLLTGKERTTGDYNRSGRSTPQRKDLYVEEDILVSPTAVDERRGSHSSRDYLADNHGEQDFFHFNMSSPSNYDREGTEARVETIHQVETKESVPLESYPQQFEPLPDTYIGTAKAPERVPIKIERRPVEVSQTSSKAYLIDNSSPNYRTSIDVTDSKDSGGKRSEHTRSEKVTNTTYTSSQKHNGTNGNHITSDRVGYPQQSNIIRIKTHSTGPESSRRDRRHVDMTSRLVSGKPQASDNISISSLSSHSSTSENSRSHEMPGSKTHHRIENRQIDNNRRTEQVNVGYISDDRIHSSVDIMPNHVKNSSNTRVYHSGKTNRDTHFRPDQENRSSQDVQYLIKSLERDTQQPHRPIPGMVGDAFSYHVTTSGKENKSSSRNNQVNEVDVTSREAMLDRESKGQGSSHIIRRYKEERTVEDVPHNSTVHMSVEPNQSQRTILLQNGQPSDRPIVFHPPSSLGRSDSDRTSTYERSGTPRGQERVQSPETTYYVDSSGSHSGKVRTEKIRLVNKEKKHHKGHSVSSDDNSSDDEGVKRRAPKSGKVSTVLYDFSSNQHPSLTNVVHLEGAKNLKSTAHNQEIYSTPRNTDKPYRARSSSESSMSDHGHKKGTVVSNAKSDQLHLTHDLNRPHPRGYKSENVFYEHYEVKRNNPMYQDGDKIVYVSPHSKHDTRNSSKEIYIDSKSHSPTRHQLSSSFSSISPTGSPTPEDKHVTTVSFDESFNRKRSASPVSTTYAYKPKMHVKKHRVVKTDEQIIRPADSDNELYVRGSRSSPYHVVVKGDKQRGGRHSDTDESFYSDSRTSGSHRSTINISKAGGRRPDPDVPAVMSIPLTNEPVAMTIPSMHETKYVTNKSERMELKRSASMDSIRDMVDYPADRSFRSEKMLQFNNSSETHASPEMRSPNSPYVSTITILNRKLNVKEPKVNSTTEVISSDDDIRYRSQLNPVKEEVVYATKEAPRETTQQRRSEKHTTYTTYEEYKDTDNFEYVVPSQTKTTTIRQERQIPIREEHIRPVREDRAKAVRESLHEKFTTMSYEQSQEPHKVEQKSGSDLKVVRGQFVIRNSMDIDLEEGDSLTLDDNINVFDNSFTMNKENPLYQSDPDIYKKFESETIEQRSQRIKAPLHDRGTVLSRDEVDAYRGEQSNIRYRQPFSPTHIRHHYDSHDLDVPYAEGDFGDGFEDIIQNTRQAAVKSAPNKKKQNLSQLLLSKLAQIDSKDITQHIDVEHHNEEIYGDIKFIHADGSKSDAMDTTNFDSVSEHIDLMLKEGKALITIKVTAERIIPVDYEFNVWRKSQAIVTRNIEIDLKANDQRRRLYEHVMETTPRKMIGSSSTGYEEANEAVLSSKDTLKLFSRLLSVAEKDDKAVERDEVRYETQHRERSDSLPSLSNADMLY